MNDREVLEALTEHGLIRRGNEIWQYGTVRFTEHGGVLCGGAEHEGGTHDRLLRLCQRLDGFVSLDAGSKTGTVVTKPLRFSGNSLELNVVAEGALQAEIQGEARQPLRGFELDNCDPISGDHLQKQVSWKGDTRVKSLEGKTLRLRFQLRQAKLYVCQCVLKRGARPGEVFSSQSENGHRGPGFDNPPRERGRRDPGDRRQRHA